VHGYTLVDPDILRPVLELRLGDIERFVTEIRTHLRAK